MMKIKHAEYLSPPYRHFFEEILDLYNKNYQHLSLRYDEIENIASDIYNFTNLETLFADQRKFSPTKKIRDRKEFIRGVLFKNFYLFPLKIPQLSTKKKIFQTRNYTAYYIPASSIKKFFEKDARVFFNKADDMIKKHLSKELSVDERYTIIKDVVWFNIKHYFDKTYKDKMDNDEAFNLQIVIAGLLSIFFSSYPHMIPKLYHHQYDEVDPGAIWYNVSPKWEFYEKQRSIS